MLRPEDVVWLIEERVFGRIVGPQGAYFTMVNYIKDGIEYEVLAENDEFEIMEDVEENDSDGD